MLIRKSKQININLTEIYITEKYDNIRLYINSKTDDYEKIKVDELN